MAKTPDAKARYEYRLLATSKTSTMTIGQTATGGQELVVITRRLLQ